MENSIFCFVFELYNLLFWFCVWAGVYTTVVDSQLHKVTVTGNVEVDVLIKKLVKTGKRVEIWPPEKPTKEKEQVKKENGDKNNGGNDKKVKEKGKEPKPSGGNADEVGARKPTSKNANAVAGKAKGVDGNSTPAAPQEEKKKKQKQQSGSDDGGDIQKEKPNSGSDSGKKGKKNQNAAGNTNNSTTADGGKDVTAGYYAGHPAAPPLNMKPYQAGYPQFPMYLPTPMYAMSYKMTHPTPSYGYYAAPPPEQMPFNNYLYSNSTYPVGPDYNYHYLPTGAGLTLLPASSGSSYDDFSEENANACNIM